MKKLLFLFLFSILSLSSKSQFILKKDIYLDKNGKHITLSVFESGKQYVFAVDFFNFESCQNISELIILESNKKVTKLKHKKYIGCEKEVVFFSIDTSKINMCDIIMVRYYNLNSMEQYNFKL